jgi:integrase
MPEKINFTKEKIDAVKCATGRRWVYDVKTPGLAMQTTATGAKSFYLYRWFQGRPERVLLGKYPDMTPEQARTAATMAAGKFAAGVNPQEQKRKARGEMTFGDLFTDWLERHAKVHKKSWRQDDDNYERYLTDWKTWKLAQVKRGDISTLHAKLGKDSGPYTANRALALVSTLFNWATSEHSFERLNPCKGIKRFKEATRERFLQADEFPAFVKALKAEPNEDMRDFFWMCLLTGARRSNVQEMKWEELNVQRAEWCIPDTKGGIPVTVPLSEPAVKILKDRMGNGSAYVFPGRGATGHLTEPKMAWANVLERAGLANLRIHDLRRTLGSWQAAAGASLSIIGKSLGHRNTATTAIYARLNIDPVRQSVTTATTAMLAAGAVKPKKVTATVTSSKALPAPTKAKGGKKPARAKAPATTTTSDEPLVV